MSGIHFKIRQGVEHACKETHGPGVAQAASWQYSLLQYVLKVICHKTPNLKPSETSNALFLSALSLPAPVSALVS